MPRLAQEPIGAIDVDIIAVAVDGIPPTDSSCRIVVEGRRHPVRCRERRQPICPSLPGPIVAGRGRCRWIGVAVTRMTTDLPR